MMPSEKREPADADEAKAHRAAMETLQTEMHAKMRAAKEKRGLIIVHTGDGKGKTTAAFGMLTRMLAHGKKCAVVQFIKSGKDAVESLLQGPNLSWHRVGEGFTWDTQDRAKDIASCREGWTLALNYLRNEELEFLLLDELNIVLGFDYLPLAEIISAVKTKSTKLHVVITGRGAKPELIELADLVTEMRELKHPFADGVKAQAGIEF